MPKTNLCGNVRNKNRKTKGQERIWGECQKGVKKRYTFKSGSKKYIDNSNKKKKCNNRLKGNVTPKDTEKMPHSCKREKTNACLRSKSNT